MSRHYHPLPFSPGGDFVWNRRTTRDGQPVNVGDPVDKAAFTPLRLRQLYESRWIVPSPFAGPPPAFLAAGAGVADRLAAELAKEEKGDGKRVPAAPSGADAAQPAAAAAPPAAKSVAPKRTPRRPAKAAA